MNDAQPCSANKRKLRLVTIIRPSLALSKWTTFSINRNAAVPRNYDDQSAPSTPCSMLGESPAQMLNAKSNPCACAL